MSIFTELLFSVTSDILHVIFRRVCAPLFFSFCFNVFLFVHVSRSITGFPAEPDEKQKETQNNSISEGKDWAVTVVTTSGRIIPTHSAHCALSLLCSQVCRRLPRPVVRGDGASRQRGASQCGGVSVCLQGGPGLRRPGDSGLRHEGEEE